MSNCGAIHVRVKEGAGYSALYRPVCKSAELFCAIAQASTLSHIHIDAIKRLGYSVEVERRGRGRS